ncbi:MAG: Rieske 2Fe-2S domain-containing protein [Acidimicrobiales bacterium]|nr:Rieske 2Fe-2S domain-containing protein [Acidimicrobiales bacterium]
METTTALLIAIPVLVVLAGVLVFASARRRDTGEAIGELARETRRKDRGKVIPTDEAAEPVSGKEVERAAALERRGPSRELATVGAKAPVAWVPPDPDVLGVTRRQFFNRGIVTFFGLGLSGFGAACLAFLWPKVGVGFGSVINIGTKQAIDAKIAEGGGFAYYPEGRMWVTKYPAAALPAARRVYSPPEVEGMEAGYTALYQKCVHLGCRVPECKTSQWFECQCHGSQYNRNGEKKGGPAPRGLDRFPVSGDGTISVDTGTIIIGPPIGTNTTGQEAEGPNCVGAAGSH